MELSVFIAAVAAYIVGWAVGYMTAKGDLKKAQRYING